MKYLNRLRKILKEEFKAKAKKRIRNYLLFTGVTYIAVIVSEGIEFDLVNNISLLLAAAIVVGVLTVLFYLINAMLQASIEVNEESSFMVLGITLMVGVVLLYMGLNGIADTFAKLFDYTITATDRSTFISFLGIFLSATIPIILTMYTIEKTKQQSYHDRREERVLNNLPIIEIQSVDEYEQMKSFSSHEFIIFKDNDDPVESLFFNLINASNKLVNHIEIIHVELDYDGESCKNIDSSTGGIYVEHNQLKPNAWRHIKIDIPKEIFDLSEIAGYIKIKIIDFAYNEFEKTLTFDIYNEEDKPEIIVGEYEKIKLIKFGSIDSIRE